MEDNYIEEIASTLEQLYLSDNIDKVNELGEKLKKFSNEDIVHVLENVDKMNKIFYLAPVKIIDRYDKMVDINKELINVKGNYLRRIFDL